MLARVCELWQFLGENGEDVSLFNGMMRFEVVTEGGREVEQVCEVVEFGFGGRGGGKGEKDGGDLRDRVSEIFVKGKHAVVEAVPGIGAHFGDEGVLGAGRSVLGVESESALPVGDEEGRCGARSGGKTASR